jgi:hypothetical protein
MSTEATTPVRPVEVGTIVMSNHGVYAYGGLPEHEGFTQLIFDLRYGGHTTLKTTPDEVAPVEVEAKVDLKDPRITVVKHDKKPGYWASGPWAASIEGGKVLSWHKTKKSGVEEMARRLAIRDWHAAADNAEVGK